MKSWWSVGSDDSVQPNMEDIRAVLACDLEPVEFRSASISIDALEPIDFLFCPRQNALTLIKDSSFHMMVAFGADLARRD